MTILRQCEWQCVCFLVILSQTVTVAPHTIPLTLHTPHRHPHYHWTPHLTSEPQESTSMGASTSSSRLRNDKGNITDQTVYQDDVLSSPVDRRMSYQQRNDSNKDNTLNYIHNNTSFFNNIFSTESWFYKTLFSFSVAGSSESHGANVTKSRVQRDIAIQQQEKKESRSS